jgi:hypothetical protein
MIRGELDDGSPYIRAVVRMPALNVRAQVDFLVDTGATHTLISPDDSSLIGLRREAFSARGALEMRGVGGTSYQYRVMAELDFLHEDGIVQTLRTFINVAAPAPDADYPSLLGIDIIGLYKLTYHLAENLVSLE